MRWRRSSNFKTRRIALDFKVILTPPCLYFISDSLYKIYRGCQNEFNVYAYRRRRASGPSRMAAFATRRAACSEPRIGLVRLQSGYHITVTRLSMQFGLQSGYLTAQLQSS
jgi:hypothetical protein